MNTPVVKIALVPTIVAPTTATTVVDLRIKTLERDPAVAGQFAPTK